MRRRDGAFRRLEGGQGVVCAAGAGERREGLRAGWSGREGRVAEDCLPSVGCGGAWREEGEEDGRCDGGEREEVHGHGLCGIVGR